RRHWLAAEARDEAIVAPAAADRAEAHRAALLVFRFDQQLNLVDRTGVVLETADDGGVDLDAIGAVTGRRDEPGNVFKLLPALVADLALPRGCSARRLDRTENGCDRGRIEAGPLGK